MAKAWVFGNNISTDLIIPGRYLVERIPEELAKHAMEGADPDFAGKVQSGDVVVAGKNFGCGSSREHAPIALRASGVSAIVAESFARIFYRNAINQGVPPLICKDVRREFDSGDEVEVDVEAGSIRNLSSGAVFETEPLPPHILDIIGSGGLIQYLKKKVRSKGFQSIRSEFSA